MNLPNKLTLLRIILVPFFVFALLEPFAYHYAAALALFIIASVTDCLDGQIARKRGLVTDFGKFADPLADKILVISALVCFVQLDIISSWLVIIVLFREFSVTSVRLVAAAKGKVVAANIWGKIKTVSQIIAIILTLTLKLTDEIISSDHFANLLSAELTANIGSVFNLICALALWVSTAFAMISGLIYISENRQFISQK